jgi:hypothetical protein
MSTIILSSATADTVLTDKMTTTTNANFEINVLPDATAPWLTDKFSLGASAPRKLDLDQRTSPGIDAIVGLIYRRGRPGTRCT